MHLWKICAIAFVLWSTLEECQRGENQQEVKGTEGDEGKTTHHKSSFTFHQLRHVCSGATVTFVLSKSHMLISASLVLSFVVKNATQSTHEESVAFVTSSKTLVIILIRILPVCEAAGASEIWATRTMQLND